MVSDEKELLRKWLGEKEYLTIFDIPKIESLGNKYFHNTKPLYATYEALLRVEPTYGEAMENAPQIAQTEDGNWALCISENSEIVLPYENMKDLLSGLLDIQEHVLPLGTVVELNKDFFARKIPEIKELESLRVVITHRFLSYLDTVYYPYAGVIYPIGMLGRTEFIHFSYGLIDNVVQEGFSDESESEYVVLMKNELLVERMMHSAGFATEDEHKRISEIWGGKDGA